MWARAPPVSFGIVLTVLMLLLGASVAGPLLAASSSLTRTGLVDRPPDHPMAVGGPVPNPPSSAAEYNVTFTEMGLPAGTLWEVETTTPGTGYGVDHASSGTAISEWWANGTYNFTASADRSNYTSPQANSTFTVAGSSLAVSVHFYPAYAVRITQTGLSNYIPWSVSVRGNGTWTNYTGAGTSVTLLVPVGPFNFTIGATGFVVTPSNGSRNGSGPTQIPVTFTVALAAPGYLTGDVNVGTASLYLNGYRYDIQLGGGYFFTLEPGLYSVIVTATGYISFYDAVYITSGNTTYLPIPLQGIQTPVVPNTSVPGIDLTGWFIIGGLLVVTAAFSATTVFFMKKARRPHRSSPWDHPLKAAEEPSRKNPPGPPP